MPVDADATTHRLRGDDARRGGQRCGAAEFFKSFLPDTIGPGSTSQLVFTITNGSASPVSALAFTDALPAGVTIATPASASSTCTDGTLVAPDGGTTISFSGGRLGANSSCTLTANITSSVVGTHTNTTDNLTSSAGPPFSTATDDLVVAVDRPGFTKSFGPSAIPLGGTSVLTFTVDSSVNPVSVFGLQFTDLLPTGMVVASPADASTDCESALEPATLTAISNTSVIALVALGGSPSFPVVAAGGTCTVTVDVTVDSPGQLVNVTGSLLAGSSGSEVDVGFATASLDASLDSLVKSFTDDPVAAGDSVTLEFRLTNLDRSFSATNISFTDDLDAVLPGGNDLMVSGSLPSAPCGAGSTLSVAPPNLLTLSGGVLPLGGSCVFSVTLDVPASTATGSYTNTTSAFSATVGGAPFAGNTASDVLVIEPGMDLVKEFLDETTLLPDPSVGPGNDVVMRFTITNPSTSSAATDIAFIDELTTIMPFPVSVTLPSTPCGAGSAVSLVGLGFERQGLSLVGGSLAAAPGAGSSCSFDVTLTVPVGFAGGTYVNTTEEISATVDGEAVVGAPASDSFEVVPAPSLVKEFTDDPVVPGGTVTLQFTISLDGSAATDATGITFTDALTATLAGLAATDLPASNVCGAGSQLSGTTTLSLTGGTLAPGTSCTMTATLQVPGGAAAASYTNTTSNIVGTVAGLTATGGPGEDDLVVSDLTFNKAFTDDPVIPGDFVTLDFMLTNASTTDTATGISFTDDLTTTLVDLAATGLPLNDACGAGSVLAGSAGDTLLTFTGGTLAPLAMCTISVTLLVPEAAVSGTYSNTTSDLSATMGGSPVTVSPATDELAVSSTKLMLTKSFTDDPVSPGGVATLQFVLTNLDASQSATGIAFTDNLASTLTGLSATGLPTSNVCGADRRSRAPSCSPSRAAPWLPQPRARSACRFRCRPGRSRGHMSTPRVG